MALEYELHNSIPGQDSRRVWFAKQLELLEKIDPKWSMRKKKDQDYILKYSPFGDNAGLRADYVSRLRKEGMSPEKADDLAKEKYPPSSKQI